MARACAFWVHFNRFNARRGEPDIWTVHTAGRDIFTRKVEVRVPLETIFRGATARQPRAYLRGVGHIDVRADKVVIS